MTAAALAAKASTTTIPIVFGVSEDPVQVGLVASLRLLLDLVPKAVHIAVLVNPSNASIAQSTIRDVQQAAPTIGLQIEIIWCSAWQDVRSNPESRHEDPARYLTRMG